MLTSICPIYLILFDYSFLLYYLFLMFLTIFFFFFKQKTAYEMLRSLVGSEMCIRDRQTQMCLYPLRVGKGPGELIDPATDLAHFLALRGPYGFIGTSWVGCAPDNGYEGGGRNQTYARPASFDVDYGEPLLSLIHI
eukprot:TRINITY_DN39131_c0_g1_i4.p1 TRINITY_DN39131_c0_g1~~TRINITY_DN39131_c0_g1_i4.p1  ORF type:complete len:137 (+),score=34.55 TRINITY_DN39131_c0_g1_i4:21-431(+)